MVSVSIRDLLDAGAHFGHQTQRWNPKMKPFIFGERNGIYIIDLQQTHQQFRKALEFITNITASGAKVMFVGTKKQAQEIVEGDAKKCSMFYVTNRWLGGTLTNFKTIKSSIDKLLELERIHDTELAKQRTKKELLMLEKQRIKLEKSLGGIKQMKKHPGAIFVIDPKKERIAVAEAAKSGVPIIALTDTNCDPDGIDFVVPGNDDAIKSIKLFTAAVRDACLEGQVKCEEKLREEQKKMEEEGGREAEREKQDAKDKAPKRAAARTRKKTRSSTKEQKKVELDEDVADGVSATPDGDIRVRR